MARTLRDANFETRTARDRLKISGKPYFRSIDAGLHLGYRKGHAGGKWVVRWYVGSQNYRVETIGAADDRIDPDGAAVLSFAQAQTKARELYVLRKREQAGLPPRSGPFTVKSCIDEYLAWMDANRKSAADARYRANALILPVLGEKDCSRLATSDIQKWLDQITLAAPRARTKKGEKQKFRTTNGDIDAKRRRRSTANRTLTVLKAALNRAWRAGKIAADDAWRRVEPFAEADAARARYLTIEEAKRLINSSDQDFRLLVQAALVTGARYGEIAALNAGDFNPDSETLHVRNSKSGRGRHIVLAGEGTRFFAALTAGREPTAPMVKKSSGDRWLQSHQARPMAAACKRARIKPAASFHCLRHTYASHAIMNGAPLLVVAKNLGHTDTRMVEKHYGHLAPSFIADAIRETAPRFGIKGVKKLTSIRTTG